VQEQPPRQRRTASIRGFSLVEVTIVLTVIGILVTMSVPSYQRALEQSRADIAAANLRAIWSAERLYWLEYHTYTADLDQLQTLGLIDPAVVLSTSGYSYSITSANATAFHAVADRSGGSYWSGDFSIDETGVVSGVVLAPGGASITIGYQ
jgi:prepilin-type N-terminal cleavage/methylation domain-containing protein